MKLTRYLAGVLGVAVAAALIAGCAGTAQVPTAAAQSAPLNGISVTGTGTAVAVPDVAYINLGVQTNGATAKAAMDSNATQMKQVVDKIKALGIADRDIQTSGVNVMPIYRQQTMQPVQPMQPIQPTEPNGVPQITGYQASNSVRVTINDVSKAGEILDGVVSVGANNVSGIQFGIKDDTKLRQQALTEAAKSAKPKAQAIADALGVKITSVASVQEQGFGGAVPMAAASIAMGKGDSTPVMPGELTVTANVTITYNFQ
ncbi:MAG: SIMPL domain-containing protein [Chloroflexota bacterium]